MDITLHKKEDRGYADHGWLKTHHSFSFASYFNPSRVHFGMLRVLNDDFVAPGRGFGEHPHANMEIVTIPLSGSLEHKDSTGRHKIIRSGEVQIMSAGSGIMHSEYNASDKEEVNFLQIWILPKKQNIEPRYDQKEFLMKDVKNKFRLVVAPDDPEALWINQDAWLHLGGFEEGQTAKFSPHPGNGIYLFVISGEVMVEDTILTQRDATAISEVAEVNLNFNRDTQILLIDIPMK